MKGRIAVAARFPKAAVAGFLGALVLARTAAALDYKVDDFRTDFSGSAADTARIDPSFGDTLKISPREFRYADIEVRNLSDSLANNGQAGGTPIVVSPASRTFKAAYLSWPTGHSVRHTLNEDDQPRANIVVRSLRIGEGSAALDAVGTRIVALENIPDPFTPAIQKPNRPPSYFHFMAEGANYAAYWGSMDPGAYLRRTTQKEAALGGMPETWGRYVYVTAPNDPVNIMGYGQHGVAYVPGTGGARTVLAYESRIDPGAFDTEVRWEDMATGTYATAIISKTTGYAEDHVVAADSAGNAVILWRENSDLYLAAFDAARTPIVPRTLVEAAVSVRIGATQHWYRPYALANVRNGSFLLAYTQGGRVHYRTLALPVGAQAYALGAETALTDALSTCNFPSIAVNPRLVLFGWFKQAGPADSLVGALFARQGGGIDPASRRDMTLTNETIAFNQAGPGWNQHHYFKAPSLALDSLGSIAVAYDNQFWAKLAIISNHAVFWDSGTFTSRPIAPGAVPAPIPLDPLVDSLEILGARAATRNSDGDTGSKAVEIALSRDGTFTDPGSAFQPVPVGLRIEPRAFRYHIDLAATPPSYQKQTKVDSLIIRWNVKPRRPAIDSIRIGSAPPADYDPSAAYSLLPRKNTLRLVVTGEELDDAGGNKFFLFSGERAVDSAVAARTGAGRFRGSLAFLPPDSLPDPLRLSVRFRDSLGWVSLPFDFAPEFRNRPPAETLAVVRRRGADVAGAFVPSSGAADTLSLAPLRLVALHLGDTASLRLRFGDANDDSLDFRLLRNGVAVVQRRVASRDPLALPLAADTLAPLVDTLIAVLSDPDTTVSFPFLVRPNRPPSIDSLWLAAFRSRDSARQAGPFDVLRDFAGDGGLQVPAGLPATLRAGVTERDAAFGDGARLAWTVLSRPAGCAAGDLACHAATALPGADSATRAFALPEEVLVVRATDSLGAFSERRARLEYPILDTAGAASLRAALGLLSSSLDFILGGSVTSRTVSAEVSSQGNVPLRILSVSTSRDARRWLDLKLAWEAPGAPPRRDSLRLRGRTDSNLVAAGNPPTVAPGSRLELTLRIFADSLRGDSVLVDTLVLGTNDLAQPFLRLPIRLVHNDLPLLRITSRGGAAVSAPGGWNDDGLPRLLPVRSSLVFAFSETVRVPDPASQIAVYSRLDSLKNPAGHRPIPGAFEYRRRASAPKTAAAWGLRADSLADTLVFRPAYDRPSDSLKVRPAPGAFVHRDILGIRVANGVIDRAGNALDLRLDRAARPAGTFDTVFQARVDTGFFRVVSTVPAAGEPGWDPDRPIRVRFNRRLAARPPLGTDTLAVLGLAALKADSNRAFGVRSAARGDRPYDAHFIALEDGDSTLVFRPRPKFSAFDTAVVTLFAGLTDVDGLTLDGNGDGFPSGYYDQSDTTDRYRFSFFTRDQEFYVYPNPFRFGSPRHLEKGSITFKNINSIPGYRQGQDVSLTVHSMTGDLVYSTRTARRSGPESSTWASLDWDVRNNGGRAIGTGVYIYTLLQGERRVLRKGKVAVIR